MKKLNLLSMRMLGIYFLLFAMVCALATFVENAYSTEVAKDAVYNTHWFEALFDIAALSLIYNIIVFKLYRLDKLAVGLFHFAFVVMILGAAVTRYTGEEGQMHIREGQEVNYFVMKSSEGMHKRVLPFSLRLDEFIVEYYPGSQNPSEYRSRVQLLEGATSIGAHEVYMNHILKYKGYRFFQSSYDQDFKGTILSVNHDQWGMTITYFGYALLLIGMVWSLFAKGSRFQALLTDLKKQQTAVLILLLLLVGSVGVKAAPTVGRDASKAFSSLWVSNGKGRIQPMNTLSRDLLTKLYKETSYQGYSSDEVMLSVIAYPAMWANEEIIYVGGGLASALGVEDEYISYNNLFTKGGSFRLMANLQRASAKPPNERDKGDKDLLALTERLSIFKMLMEGEYLVVYPSETSAKGEWLTPNAVLDINQTVYADVNDQLMMALKQGNEAPLLLVLEEVRRLQAANGAGVLPSALHNSMERAYNKMNVFTRLAPVYASIAILLLIFSVISIVNRQKIPSLSLFSAVLVISFLLHTVALAMRWYISGHAPMSNGYESMILVSWASILGGLVFAKKSPITLAISALLGAATLLVAHINSMNPEITALVPVLNSYWLSSHVASITTSYGLLTICALIGLFNVSLQAFSSSLRFVSVIRELTTISKLLMIVGLYLLTIGCFIGAVWANESWGRYWSWDPKETWCLITIVFYSFIIHMHHVPQMASHLVYNVASVWAVSSILMTYFGVNYFLGGMHSYASGEAFLVPKWIFFVVFILLVISVKAFINAKKKNN